MTDNSITAYNLPERAAVYDANMALMHPNREKMVQIALEVLPFAADAPLLALDLGVGTGYFTRCFLEAFPQATLVALDGAPEMIRLAEERLGPLVQRVRFLVGDFRELESLVLGPDSLDLVFSSFALHHLNPAEKLRLFCQANQLLRPGGWLLNADLVVAADPAIERRIQDLRAVGIVARARAAGGDPRFVDGATTRAFLDQLEAEDHDQPLTLREDLELARQAGFGGVEVFWKEHREAVFGGTKPLATC